MQTIYIEFTYSAFALSFEDQQLCGTFAAVFPTAPFSDSQEYRRIRITGTEETQYEIFLEGQSVACAMNHREASYHITRTFGDDICSHVNKNIFVMHAATVEIEGKVISLLGASGSGKTTLSLILANLWTFYWR